MTIGELLQKPGMVENNNGLRIAHKVMTKGDKIPVHDHPEAIIYFTVVKGYMRVLLDEAEAYDVTPGMVLKFDGNHTISADAMADSEVFVFLHNK